MLYNHSADGSADNSIAYVFYGAPIGFKLTADRRVYFAGLASGNTAPTTSGTTKYLITDVNGLISFTNAVPITSTTDNTLTVSGGTVSAKKALQTLTDGVTITANASSGYNFKVTLGGTGRTLTITNPQAGDTYVFEIIQGTGGSKTITTWPSGIKWQGGTAPTLSTTVGKIDLIRLFYDGINYFGAYTLGF